MARKRAKQAETKRPKRKGPVPKDPTQLLRGGKFELWFSPIDWELICKARQHVDTAHWRKHLLKEARRVVKAT